MRLMQLFASGLILVGSVSAHAQFDAMLQAEGEVYRVVDGDTYIVNIDDKDEYLRLKAEAVTEDELKWFLDRFQSVRVRLANTNTAESEHRDSSRNTREGKRISQAMEYRLTDRRVSMNCWDFGKDGRLICSLSLGGQDLGLQMVRDGMSPYVTRYGVHPYLHEDYLLAR